MLNLLYAMDPTRPANLVRFRKYCRKRRFRFGGQTCEVNNGSKSNRRAKKNYNDARQTTQVSGGKKFEKKPGAYENFDVQLKAFENAARDKYLLGLRSWPSANPPPWFMRWLANKILPTLKRIGFDDSLGPALVQIAAPAWDLIGPVNEKTVRLQPMPIREIEQIRYGILLKAERKHETPLWIAEIPLSDYLRIVKKNMEPQCLHRLLDDISTPWIILPRAFRQLKRHHCHYLPLYLKTIDKETNEESLKIFVRIVIEFVASYSLKFACDRDSKDGLEKLLFYGYAAMFWKNLRRPPNGLENSAVFDNFLNWIKRFHCQLNSIGYEEEKTIERMEKMKARLFPTKNVFQSEHDEPGDGSRFLVTLRHGCLGIKSVLKYFGIDPLLKARMTVRGLPYTTMLRPLECLLHEIKKNYHLESKPTRQFIQNFTNQLREACGVMQPRFNPAEDGFPQPLRFVGARLLSRIRNFAETI